MSRDFMSGNHSCEYCGNTIEGLGVHNGGIIVKERFCSPKCKLKFNNSTAEASVASSSESNSSSNSNSGTAAKTAGVTAGVVGGAVGGAIGGFGNLAGKGVKGLMDMAGLNYQDELERLSKMEFSEEKAELSNQLNELVTIAGGANSKGLKSGIAEKMEFGVMKLRSIGASAEADFFEEKRKKIKPKWYQ